MKYCVLILALAALIASGTTLAEDKAWSFKANPHPRKFEYSDLQDQLWQKAMRTWGDEIDICDAVLAAEYEVYKLEYPAFVFSELALEPQMHRAWRDHMVEERYHLPTQCMVRSAHARILELLGHVEWVSFRFCGNLHTGLPNTFDEDYLAAGLERMLELAALGAPEAMVNVLYYAAAAGQPNLTLNPDIEYYLRMSLRSSPRHEEHWGVAGLETHLPAERIAFLKAAVSRRDLAVVRDTSATCPAPLPRPHPPMLIGTQ